MIKRGELMSIFGSKKGDTELSVQMIIVLILLALIFVVFLAKWVQVLPK